MTRPTCSQSPPIALDSLLQEACGGSRDSLGKVLEECRAFLLLLAAEELSREVRGKGSPSDLVQQSLLEAQRDFAQFHGNTHDDLVIWLRGILLHNVSDFHDRYCAAGKRCVFRETSLDRIAVGTERLTSAEPSPSSHARLAERERLVREAIAQLPADYAEVILLRHFEHLAFAAVAARMQRSPEAVRKLWRRAIKRLETKLRNVP